MCWAQSARAQSAGAQSTCNQSAGAQRARAQSACNQGAGAQSAGPPARGHLRANLGAERAAGFLVPGRCADVPKLAGCGEYCGAGVLALLAGGRALTSHWR